MYIYIYIYNMYAARAHLMWGSEESGQCPEPSLSQNGYGCVCICLVV